MHDKETSQFSKGLESTIFSSNSQMAEILKVEIKNVNSGVKLPEFESKHCHLLWNFAQVI